MDRHDKTSVHGRKMIKHDNHYQWWCAGGGSVGPPTPDTKCAVNNAYTGGGLVVGDTERRVTFRSFFFYHPVSVSRDIDERLFFFSRTSRKRENENEKRRGTSNNNILDLPTVGTHLDRGTTTFQKGRISWGRTPSVAFFPLRSLYFFQSYENVQVF